VPRAREHAEASGTTCVGPIGAVFGPGASRICRWEGTKKGNRECRCGKHYKS